MVERQQHGGSEPNSAAGSSSAGAGGGGRGGGKRSTAGGGKGGGWLAPRGSVQLPVLVNGDPLHAQTRYKVLHQGPRLAWLELQPLTGRKHQLR